MKKQAKVRNPVTGSDYLLSDVLKNREYLCCEDGSIYFIYPGGERGEFDESAKCEIIFVDE